MAANTHIFDPAASWPPPASLDFENENAVADWAYAVSLADARRRTETAVHGSSFLECGEEPPYKERYKAASMSPYTKLTMHVQPPLPIPLIQTTIIPPFPMTTGMGRLTIQAFFLFSITPTFTRPVPR